MINSLLKTEYIQLGISGANQDEAFQEIAKMALQNEIIDDVDGYIAGLKAREEIGSTGFGDGIAIPHTKVDAVIKPSIMVVTFENPIDWDSIDDAPVNMAFVISMPGSDTENTHLTVLSQLARKLVHEEFVNSLKNAKTAEEIEKIIKETAE